METAVFPLMLHNVSEVIDVCPMTLYRSLAANMKWVELEITMLPSLDSDARSTNLRTESFESPNVVHFFNVDPSITTTTERHEDESLSQARWTHITQALTQHLSSDCPDKRPRQSKRLIDGRLFLDKSFQLDHIRIELLERPTPSTLLISWRDSQHCAYNYQLWRHLSTRSEGICALSGKEIRSGQSVYRPAFRDFHTMNADAMILASFVEMLPVVGAQT
jgi:hypothetical protein